jgi:hypothetical protein
MGGRASDIAWEGLKLSSDPLAVCLEQSRVCAGTFELQVIMDFLTLLFCEYFCKD